jgi:hypothetical protein
MPRDITRQSPLGSFAARNFIIDEADDSYDAFPAANALGYRGISSKSCKGFYKSIANATRAAAWSAQRRDDSSSPARISPARRALPCSRIWRSAR